jgi:hypothetical protein
MCNNLKITLEEGGRWMTVCLAPDEASAMLNTGLFGGVSKVYAVLFPSGVIFDFVINRWRHREWDDNPSRDAGD